MLKAVVTPVNDGLTGPGVAGHRRPVIEHLIASFDDQPIAFGIGKLRDPQLAKCFDMLLSELKNLASIEIGIDT